MARLTVPALRGRRARAAHRRRALPVLARRGGGPGRAQAELGIISGAADHEIVRKAHAKYLDLRAVRAGLASIAPIGGVRRTPMPAAASRRIAPRHLRDVRAALSSQLSLRSSIAAHPRPAIALSGSKPRVTAPQTGVGLGLRRTMLPCALEGNPGAKYHHVSLLSYSAAAPLGISSRLTIARIVDKGRNE
jgi:hypothetical protein